MLTEHGSSDSKTDAYKPPSNGSRRRPTTANGSVEWQRGPGQALVQYHRRPRLERGVVGRQRLLAALQLLEAEQPRTLKSF
jgi:hypothetical protein